MATRASIEFDFNRALNQAKKLEEVASKMKSLSESSLENTLQDISVNWKGENASVYLKKGEKLKSKVMGSAEQLNAIAGEIRKIAKRVYDAEMAALAIAEMRNY